jgi:hypothetical protein
MVPTWKIYSYWAFGLTALWLAGLLPFSPLASCVGTLIGSIVFVIIGGTIFKPIGMFIVATHVLPVLLLRETKLNFFKNFLIFGIYNLVLLGSGTNFKEVYDQVFRENPQTIKDYLLQRGLM